MCVTTKQFTKYIYSGFIPSAPRLEELFTSNKTNPMSSKLNNAPEIPLCAYQLPNGSNLVTINLIQLTKIIGINFIWKYNFSIKIRNLAQTIARGAHVSEPDKSYKIWTPIQPRVQPYQIYQNPTSFVPSNPQITLSKIPSPNPLFHFKNPTN